MSAENNPLVALSNAMAEAVEHAGLVYRAGRRQAAHPRQRYRLQHQSCAYCRPRRRARRRPAYPAPKR